MKTTMCDKSATTLAKKDYIFVNMSGKIKVMFISCFTFICMLNPGCKHGTNDAKEIYRRYAIKNITVIRSKKL